MKKIDVISEHWENQAKKFKTSSEASWGDTYCIDLEIQTISKYLKKGDKVLEVGCANGYSSFEYLKMEPGQLVGLDYSDSMIKYARQQKEELNIGDTLSFQVGDIKELPFDSNAFDLTFTTRVVINLPDWKMQEKAIRECIRVTKKGGTIILSEAFKEPLGLLNAMRALKDLAPLEEPEFNSYLRQTELDSLLQQEGLEYEVLDFSSVYYLGSRFLRELVTNPSDYPGYSNPVNEDFFKLEEKYSGGGFGIQQAYIIKK